MAQYSDVIETGFLFLRGKERTQKKKKILHDTTKD
jgi:hypothetical protein